MTRKKRSGDTHAAKRGRARRGNDRARHVDVELVDMSSRADMLIADTDEGDVEYTRDLVEMYLDELKRLALSHGRGQENV